MGDKLLGRQWGCKRIRLVSVNAENAFFARRGAKSATSPLNRPSIQSLHLPLRFACSTSST
jgi:hypothetical protein